MDEFNKNFNSESPMNSEKPQDEPAKADVNNTTDTQSQQTTADTTAQGFYSYKYPDTANNPQYSATSDTYSETQAQQAQQQPYTPNYSQSAPKSTYSPIPDYSQYNVKPVKPKKDKKKFSFGALIACCLICALLAGGVSAVGVSLASNYLTSSNDSSSGNTVINVDKTSTNAVSAVAQKVIPSVVGIKVTTSVQSFFGMSQDSTSEGTGVIYSSDGYIITNYHVIASSVESTNATSQGKGIVVYLASDSDKAIDAEVVGYNSESDLAVLKINKTGLTAAEFADSDSLEVGELAVAIGNPGGLDYMNSVSSGIISGLNRTLKLESTTEMKLIQTDAAINPGNSGGALCNSDGKIIGINSSKISDTDYEGMGFAIPSNYVKTICDDIINNKDVKRAYLGITLSTEYDSATLQAYGYPAGAVVESVTAGSPAANAGIKQADIITSFNGIDISDASGYNSERLKCSPGETISLTVYRGGQSYNVSLTLGESNN